ncbi:MAG TPA: hypothetical protein VFV02_04330 [Acidimicrobiales bacterium]|nr:hypothetical protein [Acidimicrobiales bacterium]
MSRGGLWSATGALLRRPDLWRVAARMAPPRWWQRWPPIPLPPNDYRKFRLETMYGDGSATLDGHDLIVYLEWCRRMQRDAR